MRRRLPRALILLLWAALMARLLAQEVFPGFWRTRLAGYRDRFAGGPPLAEQWLRIRVQDTPVGYSHTRIDFRTEDGRDRILVENRTFLHLALLGQTRALAVVSSAELDGEHRLQRFEMQLESAPYRFRAEGRRAAGNRFEIGIETPALRESLSVAIPDDAILYSPLGELALARLAPGRSLRLRVFDPVSLSTADLVLRALRREEIELDGERRAATLVLTEYRGLEIRSWIAPDGRALRQETPFGWTLEAAAPEAALAAARARRAAPEILTLAAVPIAAGAPPDLDARALWVRLSGAPALARHPDFFPRQTVIAREADALTLRLIAAPERLAPEGGLTPEQRRKWLEATPFVPSDHPEIRRQAEAIAGGAHAPLAAAEALNEWLYRHIRKTPSAGLPSALDVLREREGDCNEHTYLFVALARALGIPARIFVGLVPHDGAFYYHAWPAVYADGWIELDPTLGLRRVGAAHIALAEGEFEGQMALAGLIGRLRAEVRDASGD